MSIVTKTGDSGTTGLMYNRRVSKTHPRVEACGAVDELNACLGVARTASASDPWLDECLRGIQQELVVLMGELATHPDDLERYGRDGYRRFKPESTARLEQLVREVEQGVGGVRGWATPGASPGSAALDLARAVCRRAERRVCQVDTEAGPGCRDILVYLNRLADLLWLLARRAELAGRERGAGA